nr:formate dehydrogenase accessory sulfurtransferase FdhD [uncultured Holophaga sp.]
MDDKTPTRFPVTVLRLGSRHLESSHRSLVQEAPLIISVNWVQEYSIMRTPGHDEELTAGFLFTEGIIQAMEEVTLMRKCKGEKGGMDVSTLDTGRPAVKRSTTVSSSCGLCGRVELDALIEGLQPVTEAFPFPAERLHGLPDRVREAQALFHTTGASHAVALFNGAGEVVVLREDVGRHNAFDKVIGERLLGGHPLSGHGAFLSGRASLEMLIKAARAGFPLVASVSAPTDLAVQAAERLNITLCGFVRGREITIYTHPERIGV